MNLSTTFAPIVLWHLTTVKAKGIFHVTWVNIVYYFENFNPKTHVKKKVKPKSNSWNSHIYETIYSCNFSTFFINLRNLLRAFKYIAALESKIDTFLLNLNSWSISTPCSFTDLVVSMSLSLLSNLCDLCIYLFYPINCLLCLFSSFKFLKVAVIILSPAKLCQS